MKISRYSVISPQLPGGATIGKFPLPVGVSHLNLHYRWSCSAFFQRCNPRWGDSGRWYDNMPVGKSTLGKMISKISEEAQLSKRYTNHCLRATTVTAFSYAGIAPKDICSVTGHRSEASLKHNCEEPTDEQKADMSKKLHSYMKKSKHSETEPETPEVPSVLSEQNNAMTLSPKPGPSHAPDGPSNAAMLPHQGVSNIVTVSNSLTKYTAAGAMFAGAIFNGPTTFNFHWDVLH